MEDFKNATEPLTIKRLSVLVPVYNGEQSVGDLVTAVLKNLEPHYPEVEIVLVNDGSQDDSHGQLLDLAGKHPGKVRYVQLARNFGEHNAVMCGLRHISGDAVVIIDDDFQNPPEEIHRLAEKLKEGYDVVYSYYEERSDSGFRQWGSNFNDWVAGKLIGKPRNLYLSSFKAMNRFLVDTVVHYEGPFPYVDGIILRSTRSVGRQVCRHDSRRDGESGYNLRRLIRLWLNMFTGFSITPLRIATYVGLTMSLVGMALAVYFVVSRMVGGIFSRDALPPGWASLIVCVTVFSGLQLSVLGVLGEYLGRLFLTINRMPQFVVRETYGFEEKGAGDDGTK